MNLSDIFDKLWNDYISQNPSAGIIHNLFINEAEQVVNDHIAFRTLDFPEINIEALALPFTGRGYTAMGEYVFKEKHLLAKHFEVAGDKTYPRIFISQLILSECSPYLQKTLEVAYKKSGKNKLSSDELIFSGSLLNVPSFKVYEELRNESEYAAWFYVFGLRVNHFTVSINSLRKFNNILKVNEFLKSNGILLNTSGGEVKGTPSDLLQQSSTMADIVPVQFSEGIYNIPSCYYEFAQRYPDSEGRLYSGFITKSADKIFESTHFYRRK